PNEGNLDHASALDAGGYFVHPERGRADDDAVVAGSAEGAHQQVDRFVAAASGEHVLWRHRVKGRQMPNELGRLRLRVAIQAGGGLVAGGAPGHLVGVQPFERGRPGGVLVRLEREDVGPREPQDVVHGALACPANSARRTSTAFAWAPRPSSPAITIAVGPRSRNPSTLSSCTVMRRMKSLSERPL